MRALYRVSIKPRYTYGVKQRPMYVTAASKDAAKAYVQKYLKATYAVSQVKRLGKELGPCMWHSDTKDRT